MITVEQAKKLGVHHIASEEELRREGYGEMIDKGFIKTDTIVDGFITEFAWRTVRTKGIPCDKDLLIEVVHRDCDEHCPWRSVPAGWYDWDEKFHKGKIWDCDLVMTAWRPCMATLKRLVSENKVISYPEPFSGSLNEGDVFWEVSDPHDEVGEIGVTGDKWDDYHMHVERQTALRQGRIHLTKEAAQSHCEILFGSKGKLYDFIDIY